MEKGVLPVTVSEIDLAELGDGELAYIKEMSTEEARTLFPQVKIPEGIEIFAVHGADGTPIALTDTRFAAIASAKEQNLELVSVH